MDRKGIRRNIVNSLKKELMGPTDEEESLEDLPTRKYMTGVLYPKIIDEEEDKDVDDDRGVMDEDEETYSEPHLPNSMGLSCIIDSSDPDISIELSCAVYLETREERWRRVPISEEDVLEIKGGDLDIRFGNSKESGRSDLTDFDDVPDHFSRFFLRWETSPLRDEQGDTIEDVSYLSIFLVNERESRSFKKAQDSLYQTYLAISTGESHSIISREIESDKKDEEKRSLSLLYHDKPEFGVGHQISINWDPFNDSDIYISDLDEKVSDDRTVKTNLPSENMIEEDDHHCKKIESTFFPEHHMRSLDFEVDFDDERENTLDMYVLSDKEFLESKEGNKEEVISRLRLLTDEYEDWIERNFSEEKKQGFDKFGDVFEDHKERCERSLERMREGIRLLNEDDEAYASFCLMNRAIWLQLKNKEKSKGTDGTYVVDLEHDQEFKWYPFQLGFILQNLCGVADETHEDRELVDLLWIPTGGGKTEAYLGLVAFRFFLDRLKGDVKEKDGVEVMMRYTLRLLTLQQFQRAARLILACEHIRLADDFPWLEGCSPFSVGLYVGQSTTPNKVTTGYTEEGYDNDYDLYEKVYKTDKKEYGHLEWCQTTAEYALEYWKRKHELPEKQNPVQILRCPWCGEEFTPKDYEITEDVDIKITCSNEICLFHRNPLPIKMIDSPILDDPPSLVIGTVDKLAQLPFKEDLGNIFGWRDGRPVGEPPSLIIQDELHLINGPLGSMVGIYESTIDYLSSRGMMLEGSLEDLYIEDIDPERYSIDWEKRPKIIASTATIRNAKSQCQELYNRRSVRFPAPGTKIYDSFFVNEREDRVDDKAYVGLMCQGIGMKTSFKRTVSDVLKNGSRYRSLEDVPQKSFDPYWTVVSYFNTKKELGRGVTLLRADVLDRVKDDRPSIINEKSIGELHGGLDSTELPEVLERMSEKVEDEDTYDVICCTNMFSVGVDIDRLGLMVMNSQPKATTEYLQSTGRVGRKGDGLILMLYNQARPRDLSHFESFYDYHSRIQAHVESMTVTPYSDGCLERAIHAQYVSLMRIASLPTGFSSPMGLESLRENPDCINYSLDHRDHMASLDKILYLVQRAREISKDENTWTSVLRDLKAFSEDWLRRIDEVKGKGDDRYIYHQKIVFQRRTPRLLEQDPSSNWLNPEKRQQDYGYRLSPKLTPNSLRNVEEEIDLIELRRDYDGY